MPPQCDKAPHLNRASRRSVDPQPLLYMNTNTHPPRLVITLFFLALLASLAATSYLLYRSRCEIANLKNKIAAISSSSRIKTVVANVVTKAPEFRSSETTIRSVTVSPNWTQVNDPAFAPLLQKQTLRNIRRNYVDGISKLNLPPDKLKKLEELLVARAQAPIDALNAEHNLGITDSKEISKTQQYAVAEVNDNIEALIGTSGVATLDLSSQLHAERSMLDNGVAIDLQAAGTPLTADQETALAQTILDTSNVVTNPNYSSLALQPADPSTGLSAVQAAIDEKASQFLSTDQLNILKSFQQEQNANREYLQTKH
jgi:hypothetical protein